MTLDHKCQIFQNLNAAVGKRLFETVRRKPSQLRSRRRVDVSHAVCFSPLTLPRFLGRRRASQVWNRPRQSQEHAVRLPASGRPWQRKHQSECGIVPGGGGGRSQPLSLARQAVCSFISPTVKIQSQACNSGISNLVCVTTSLIPLISRRRLGDRQVFFFVCDESEPPATGDSSVQAAQDRQEAPSPDVSATG